MQMLMIRSLLGDRLVQFESIIRVYRGSQERMKRRVIVSSILMIFCFFLDICYCFGCCLFVQCVVVLKREVLIFVYMIIMSERGVRQMVVNSIVVQIFFISCFGQFFRYQQIVLVLLWELSFIRQYFFFCICNIIVDGVIMAMVRFQMIIIVIKVVLIVSFGLKGQIIQRNL